MNQANSLHSPTPRMWFLSPFLFASLLEWGWGLFFHGGLFEAFLTMLNGTMVPAYRADSCFIEPVYSVRWMEHINRLTLTSPRKRKIRKKKKREKKALLTLRHNGCLFHRCHLSTTACFTIYNGAGGSREKERSGVCVCHRVLWQMGELSLFFIIISGAV